MFKCVCIGEAPVVCLAILLPQHWDAMWNHTLGHQWYVVVGSIWCTKVWYWLSCCRPAIQNWPVLSNCFKNKLHTELKSFCHPLLNTMDLQITSEAYTPLSETSAAFNQTIHSYTWKYLNAHKTQRHTALCSSNWNAYVHALAAKCKYTLTLLCH